MLNIHEIWHYDEFETGGSFAGYIKTFLRLKQQADGWPSDNMTDAEKDAYIEDYERVEGNTYIKFTLLLIFNGLF